MKSILMSIKPYYGFLIIATMKGWDLAKYGLREKTVEVRKGVPTSPDWDKRAALYFSKDKKSLACVPEEYRGEVAKLCGKVVGEFVCDEVIEICFECSDWSKLRPAKIPYIGLTDKEIVEYLGNGKSGYGLHISDLKIYDKPKDITRFNYLCVHDCCKCNYLYDDELGRGCCCNEVTRPPQSWHYVETWG